MKYIRLSSLILLITGLICMDTFSIAEVLTLEKAVRLALKNNLQIKSQKTGVEVAVMDKNSARALWGPRLMVNVNGFYFSEKASINMDLGGSEPEFPPPTQEEMSAWDQGDVAVLMYLQRAMGSFMSSVMPSGPIEVGEQYQVTVQVILAQPLTKLFSVYHLNKMKALGIDIAKIQLRQKEVELAYQVKSNYYKLLVALHSKEALEAAKNMVEAQLKQARAAKEAGLLKQGDILRAQVGRAQISQTIIAVERGITLAKEALKTIINASSIKDIQPVEVALPEFKLTLDKCIEKAKKQRPELVQLRLSIEQVEHGLKATFQEFFPDINFVAQYQHIEGSGIEQPDFAVGGSLSWTVWAWGESYYKYKKLKKQLKQLKELKSYVESMLVLEVKAAFNELKTKQDEIRVAEMGIESAKESLRVEEARYRTGEVTNTEVLKAITDLAQAKLNLIKARYGYLEALAKLKKAMGEL